MEDQQLFHSPSQLYVNIKSATAGFNEILNAGVGGGVGGGKKNSCLEVFGRHIDQV
jgi:hypothetical protein